MPLRDAPAGWLAVVARLAPAPSRRRPASTWRSSFDRGGEPTRPR